MAAVPKITLAITADTSSFSRACRIIASHLTALAAELEAPASDEDRIRDAMADAQGRLRSAEQARLDALADRTVTR